MCRWDKVASRFRLSIPNHFNNRRFGSLDYQSALRLLKLKNSNTTSGNSNINLKDLRKAYFQAAKQCHPDTIVNESSTQVTKQDSSAQFMLVSEAYEVLLSIISPVSDGKLRSEGLISEREEIEFRRNCQDWLGIPADVVEESKRCPLFRQWLKGNTDAAFHWKVFLMQVSI